MRMYVVNRANSILDSERLLIIIIQFNVIEATMVQNSSIMGHQKSQYSMSLGVRVSERVQSRRTSERCEWVVRANEWVVWVSSASEWCERTSERCEWAVQANGLATGPVLKPWFLALFNYRAHAQNDKNYPFEAKYLHTRLYELHTYAHAFHTREWWAVLFYF